MPQPAVKVVRGAVAGGEGPPRGSLAASTLTSRRRLWLPSSKSRIDLVRRVLAPLILALLPIFWVGDATYRASLAALGRDQGIFQYVAWAVRRGEVDYRDIRDVNGPLVHMIHLLFLALGGADEHRFRVLDLSVTGASFAFAGWCLPGLASRSRPKWFERVTWAFATCVVLCGQYQLYLPWNQAQRESFCDWFLLPSIALQLTRTSTGPRAESGKIMCIAALSSITWFGKPSFALFTFMQLTVLLVDQDWSLGRKSKLAWFIFGAVLGVLAPLGYLVVFGNLSSFLRISLLDVPQIYRFIWAKSSQEIFGDDGPLLLGVGGLAACALVLALVATRELPRRALVVALAPVCAIANVVVQHKGFGYHFHPLSATTRLAFLLVIAMLWERFRSVSQKNSLGRLAALFVTVSYAVEVAASMKGSPLLHNVWLLSGGETAERRQTEEYFQTFKSHDFFPWEMRQAAAYLRASTDSMAKIQVYGMDPYLLFLAERKSATPYIYAYDLNDDAALDGGWSSRPNPMEAAKIRDARDSHERDMLSRLQEAPPEAFVFIDRAPLISYPDAWDDFRYCCVASADWVASKYHPARAFGDVHIWMRNAAVPNEGGTPPLLR